MTDTKHTPFRAVYNNARREYEIFGGYEVDAREVTDEMLINSNYEGFEISYLFTIEEDAIGKEDASEIVRLIVAAPELLAIAQYIANRGACKPLSKHIKDQARAVIAKAEKGE